MAEADWIKGRISSGEIKLLE